jgi:hypothetical protein
MTRQDLDQISNEQFQMKELKNKGFSILDEMFKKHGWNLIINEMTMISYTKTGHETDTFEIQIGKNNIRVCIPLKNSSYQYVTYFNDYFQTSEYIEARFNDFIE